MTFPASTRRDFLFQLTAATSLPSLSRIGVFGIQASVAGLPPEITSGRIQPLLQGAISRPLRYVPDGGGFVIHNGKEVFNRPLYSTSAFRVDAGDLPEFSLYLPGHGGNLKLGIVVEGASKWLSETESILARYERGLMVYEVRDKLLGEAILRVKALTGYDDASLIVRAALSEPRDNVHLAWAFGGASGRKGKRGGDIGCESQPVSELFQVREQDCAENHFSLVSTPGLKSARLDSPAGKFRLAFPAHSSLGVSSYPRWMRAPERISSEAPNVRSASSILVGSASFSKSALYIQLSHEKAGMLGAERTPEKSFFRAEKSLMTESSRLLIDSPDPYVNAAVVALCSAELGIWDEGQGCVMHGAVAWRSPLAGWRGPYVLDVLGEHDKAQMHFRRWLARQNTSAVTATSPETGPFDPNKAMSRKEGLLHSNGDLSHNHYDMNLVFFDVLLRHLRWTGDTQFAKEVWPAYQRHLQWEKRLFRREFLVGEKKLPLYEAYAAIWASDNLQYNGGGTAHSTAYNAFSFHRAADIAKMLGEDAEPFSLEARQIDDAIQRLLWIPEKGELAEAKDLMEPQTVYDNGALWTLYHAIDSEVLNKQQAWQMTANRLHSYKQIPIEGDGVPRDGHYILSCSNWFPYMWSLNLLLMAENSHLALAMWQIGMKEEAFRLFKGNLLDSMYQGLCPGNFHMTSQLDVHRQEAQRDFGDPIGITARAMLEGLYGIRPNLLEDRVTWMPGFPEEWDRASMTHRDFCLNWQREGQKESYALRCEFKRRVRVRFVVPARSTVLPYISAQGHILAGSFDEESIGRPWLVFEVDQNLAPHIEIHWRGEVPQLPLEHKTYAVGELLQLPSGLAFHQIEDPQGSLQDGHIKNSGFHTVFVLMKNGDARWFMPISFTAKSSSSQRAFRPPTQSSNMECVELSSFMSSHLSTIFKRGYTNPRSPYCSLAIPDTLLGGWADIGEPLVIDDRGIRASPTLLVAESIPFQMHAEGRENCLFLSRFEPDAPVTRLPLHGAAKGVYILITGTTVPQCSHMTHATMIVHYADSTTKELQMRSPQSWWPIEQDYLFDDYLFCGEGPLPPRVDLASGKTRLITLDSFKGKGRMVPGGAATALYLEIDSTKELASVEFRVELYGIVFALLGVTLERKTDHHLHEVEGDNG
jgi:hypothetical protein